MLNLNHAESGIHRPIHATIPYCNLVGAQWQAFNTNNRNIYLRMIINNCFPLRILFGCQLIDCIVTTYYYYFVVAALISVGIVLQMTHYDT